MLSGSPPRGASDAIPASEDFIAMAAHELRGSAAVITAAAASLQTLLDPDAIGAQANDVLAILARNAQHMTKLAMDVLSAAYLDHGDLPLAMDAVPVLPIIRWAVDASAAPSGSVRVECDPQLTATADADHLEQILTNLVANALKHGAAPVVVSGRAMTHAPGTIVLVRDSGDGVAPGDAPALFDRFSPLAARNSTSTGLGLSISRSLARAMGGDLTYRGEGAGSTFVLALRA